MKQVTQQQKGFTLVEIAIVLVIIGLLIGGVLKGQALIENGTVKSLANEMRSLSTMVNGYRDLYRAIPGDDAKADLNQKTALKSTTNPGNGAIDSGKWIGDATVVATDETTLFWQHVRLAGLASGSASSGTATNALGGKLGITSNNFRPKTPDGVNASYYVCSSAIPGKTARALDIMLDDGVSEKGQLFGSEEGTTGAVTAADAALPKDYDDAKKYTVCLAQ
ncbi:prepilin-type N-terminal cleavage/methylation domain-containing protein [Massilia oculi]|uniref:Prepilin-type N-terminal cleavage/methylation domain-containing protein n=1 Tax=Massilia hydrophila TaxID=3044279 RepID=A0ABS7YBP5_9BURK|nr:prepilin-type N-terminal cleavage/methylation domain-containing protein [Massilia oculi]MCA1857102.1 prepilin-type N-terminal cleavage/methylation domain-containing protein [Massilia oculi]